MCNALFCFPFCLAGRLVSSATLNQAKTLQVQLQGKKNVQTVHKREIIYYSTSLSAAVAVYNHILKQIDVNDKVELILFTIKQHKKPE